MITAASTLEDIAYIVCTLFQSNGKTIVLTGGSAATIYTPDHYQSRDLDFVLQFDTAGQPLLDKLAAIGYESGPGSAYVHPQSKFTIDFIADTLAIGEMHISSWATLHRGSEVLNILTPEDCICDRLANYIYWNDLSALKAAAGVYRSTNADLQRVRQWLRSEGVPIEQTMMRLISLTN